MNRSFVTLACALLVTATATAVARPAGGPIASSAAKPAGVPVASAAATYTTKLKDSYFSPSTITANGKTTVRFVWAGKLAHNLVGRGIPRTYVKARVRHRTLTRTYGRGVYTLLCTIHPGMELKLRVR